MNIGLAGSDSELDERLNRALSEGMTILPCSADQVAENSPRSLEALVIGPSIPIEAALRMAQSLDSARPDLGVIIVAEPHPQLLRAALLAGARDVWSPAITDEDLRLSLTRVLTATEKRRAGLAKHAAPRNQKLQQVIAILSPKGGAGKTTIATNLATGIATLRDEPVGIIDLDLQFGDVATALNIEPEYTLADAVSVSSDLTALKTMMVKHGSGAFVMCAPTDPALADRVTPDATEAILTSLATQFGTLIVDTSAGLDEHTLGALDLATDLIVISTPDIFAINGTRKLLDILEQIDMGEPDRHLILNRSNARVDIDRREIEKALGWRVDLEIPSTRAVPLAMNRGESLLDAGRAAKKPMQQLLARFADAPNAKGPA